MISLRYVIAAQSRTKACRIWNPYPREKVKHIFSYIHVSQRKHNLVPGRRDKDCPEVDEHRI